MNEKYDLLKPKTPFYTLLVITSCCISWMVTIFLAALIQVFYSNVQTVPLIVFIVVTAIMAAISSVINIIVVNRLFRIYVLNVKGAFKIDYGHQYVHMSDGLKDYEPENSIEAEELMITKKEDGNYNSVNSNNDEFTHLMNIKEDISNLNSTRKLLGDDS